MHNYGKGQNIALWTLKVFNDNRCMQTFFQQFYLKLSSEIMPLYTYTILLTIYNRLKYKCDLTNYHDFKMPVEYSIRKDH